jgi:hypothetical protein
MFAAVSNLINYWVQFDGSASYNGQLTSSGFVDCGGAC